MTVVAGPTADRPPMRVRPRRNVDGSTTVSGPIVTSASMSVLAGSTIVTPARWCAWWIRRWAIAVTTASSTRSLTPSASSGSGRGWA
jgi:hypothetical protein